MTHVSIFILQHVNSMTIYSDSLTMTPYNSQPSSVLRFLLPWQGYQGFRQLDDTQGQHDPLQWQSNDDPLQCSSEGHADPKYHLAVGSPDNPVREVEIGEHLKVKKRRVCHVNKTTMQTIWK